MTLWPPVEPVQRDHYYELQVDYRATNTEIRKAYLKLSLEHHPDKLPPNASDANFKRVSNLSKGLFDTCIY
jgi:DnaJ-class molecular chaperone